MVKDERVIEKYDRLASLGLALRATGQGLKVCMIQFLKRNSKCGEHLFTERTGVFGIFQFGTPPLPEGEKLRDLAKHKASLAMFLSIHIIDKVVKELKEGYEEDTPCAVVYKASWEDEKNLRSRLYDKTFSHGFRRAQR